MKVAYARESTVDQNLDMQTDALKREGCKEIFEDHASGAKADRDGLRKALNQETTFVVFFVNHNQYQKGEQHDQIRKHRADRSYNTVGLSGCLCCPVRASIHQTHSITERRFIS